VVGINWAPSVVELVLRSKIVCDVRERRDLGQGLAGARQ
jgi:hypothetical protein